MTQPARSSEYLLFKAGGVALGVPIEHVHAVHESLDTVAVANTCNWFTGLAVAEGALVPVSDLGAFLFDVTAHGAILQVSKKVGLAGLRVDKVVGVSASSTRCKHESENKSKAMQKNAPLLSDACIKENGVEYTLLDLAALLRSRRFANIDMSPA